MYKFIKEYEKEDEAITATKKVELTVHSDASLNDLFEAFKNFLLASGYVFDGEIDLIQDKDNIGIGDD